MLGAELCNSVAAHCVVARLAMPHVNTRGPCQSILEEAGCADTLTTPLRDFVLAPASTDPALAVQLTATIHPCLLSLCAGTISTRPSRPAAPSAHVPATL